MLDIKKLEYHASVSNKVPIFLIQFLKYDKIYALVNLEDLDELHEIFNNENNVVQKKGSDSYEEVAVVKKMVSSSSKARKQFFEEKEKQYAKRKRN